ncbi:MAG: acyl-CoA dehydratase activase-related protein [Thermodesulfobacteriota bacterium]
MKIGIPRGLLFYRYFPLWETFFETLGIEVVVSDPTTEETVREGSKFVPSDLCLPVKIFFGHVESIRRKVDYLFIPRFISIEPDAYMCPKLMGLPDMVRASMDSLPPLIENPIHCKAHGARAEENFYLKIGRIFLKDKEKVARAYSMAIERQSRFRSLLRQGFSFDQALDFSRSPNRPNPPLEVREGRIGVIGRPYYVHDFFLGRHVVEQIEASRFSILTPESLSDQQIEKGIESLRKRIYWSYGKEMVGSAIHFAQSDRILGIINLASFGCGQDSFNVEMIQHLIREKLPFLQLVFDEHISKSGFSTRVEAFLEMMTRQKKRE